MKIYLGYFYDGKLKGNYGVLHTLEEDPWCFRCLDDNECEEGETCDLTSRPEHSCVTSENETITSQQPQEEPNKCSSTSNSSGFLCLNICFHR